MRKNNFKLRLFSGRKITFLLIPPTLVYSNIPHRGISEGGQGEISNISDKVDFWGALLPILTPNNTAIASFFLSCLSIGIFWLGFYFVASNREMSNKHFALALVFGLLGAIFTLQNLRDAFLLSLSMLSLGLIEKYRYSSSTLAKFSFLLPLVLAITFKYPSAVAITLLLLLRFFSDSDQSVLRKIILILAGSFSILLMGVIVDKSLARAAHLERGFVEQSVMYYDLASFYCWSESNSTRSKALETLDPILKTEKSQDVCLSHRPNAWIYLVSGGNFKEQGVGPPLQMLSGDPDSERAIVLRDGWLKTIAGDPVDYIQFKLIAATQILTVGNPFVYAGESFTFLEGAKTLNDFIWKLLSIILMIIGKSYVFSVSFLLMVCLGIVIRGRFNLWRKSTILSLLFVNVVNLIVLSIAYVSDEARYVFPIITLSYIVLAVDFQVNKNKLGLV